MTDAQGPAHMIPGINVLFSDCLRFALSGKTIHEILMFTLEKVCSVTSCEYGFIGELLKNQDGVQYHRFHAVTGFPPGHPYIRSFERNRYVDFSQPDTMHAAVLTSDVPIIWNDIKAMRKGKPYPEGHPDLKCAVMYPLKHNGLVVGSMGLSSETPFEGERLITLATIVEMVTAILVIVLDKKAITTQKNNFLANISHEIRTPLNGIVQCSSMIKDTALTQDQIELVNIINQCSIQLLDIASDILDYTKIMSGYLKLIMRPMSLHTCLSDIFAIYKERTDERGLTLKLEYENAVPDMVIGDNTRLTQILLNLLSNAVKYTRIGSITLKVRNLTDQKSVNAVTLQFTLTDTGIGIDKSRIPQLFDTFGHSENYLCSESGVGIGLPITEHLVRMHGGKIGITSIIGHGTTVQFTLQYEIYHDSVSKDDLSQYFYGKSMLVLCGTQADKNVLFETLTEYDIRPFMVNSTAEIDMYLLKKTFSFDFVLVDEELAPIDLPKKAGKATIITMIDRDRDSEAAHVGYGQYHVIRPVTATEVVRILTLIYLSSRRDSADVNVTDSVPNPGLKILVAEDDITNQKVLTLVMNKLGYYDITITNDGLEMYMELIKSENDYDVAFVDLKMPIMDGITAVKKFRANCSKKITIVALTASMTGNIREECYAAGMNGYITKPVKTEELSSMLKLIERKKQASRN